MQHPPTVGYSKILQFVSQSSCGIARLIQVFIFESRCSDGIDRHRQEWLDYNCPEEVRRTPHVHTTSITVSNVCLWLIPVSTQAKGTCEDFNPELTDGSMSSFNVSFPTSSAALEGQPVTQGNFFFFHSRRLTQPENTVKRNRNILYINCVVKFYE